MDKECNVNNVVDAIISTKTSFNWKAHFKLGLCSENISKSEIVQTIEKWYESTPSEEHTWEHLLEGLEPLESVFEYDENLTSNQGMQNTLVSTNIFSIAISAEEAKLKITTKSLIILITNVRKELDLHKKSVDDVSSFHSLYTWFTHQFR